LTPSATFSASWSSQASPERIRRRESRCAAHPPAQTRADARDPERERRASEDAEFERELFREIARLFPGCPTDRARAIAHHTSERGSGRVGRTAAARAFDREAVTLAVVAAARHGDSNYDELLMAGVERSEARRAASACR
jgi:hypothetical protein